MLIFIKLRTGKLRPSDRQRLALGHTVSRGLELLRESDEQEKRIDAWSCFCPNLSDQPRASRCPSLYLRFPTCVIRHERKHPHVQEVLTGQRSQLGKPNPPSQSHRPFFTHYGNDHAVDQQKESRAGLKTEIWPYRVAKREKSGAWVGPIN